MTDNESKEVALPEPPLIIEEIAAQQAPLCDRPYQYIADVIAMFDPWSYRYFLRGVPADFPPIAGDPLVMGGLVDVVESVEDTPEAKRVRPPPSCSCYYCHEGAVVSRAMRIDGRYMDPQLLVNALYRAAGTVSYRQCFFCTVPFDGDKGRVSCPACLPRITDENSEELSKLAGMTDELIERAMALECGGHVICEVCKSRVAVSVAIHQNKGAPLELCVHCVVTEHGLYGTEPLDLSAMIAAMRWYSIPACLRPVADAGGDGTAVYALLKFPTGERSDGYCIAVQGSGQPGLACCNTEEGAPAPVLLPNGGCFQSAYSALYTGATMIPGGEMGEVERHVVTGDDGEPVTVMLPVNEDTRALRADPASVLALPDAPPDAPSEALVEAP